MSTSGKFKFGDKPFARRNQDARVRGGRAISSTFSGRLPAPQTRRGGIPPKYLPHGLRRQSSTGRGCPGQFQVIADGITNVFEDGGGALIRFEREVPRLREEGG
ncbi:MAG: hypothetical protein R2867_41415 [Caldilineaceae bacterium]